MRVRAARGTGVREVGIFAAAYVVYFGVRALTEGSATRAAQNALELIRFERLHGILWEGALQRAVLERGLFVDAANAVYMYGHWPVIITAGVLLFHYRPDQYARLRDACLLSGLIGLVVFSLFPVAPPRLTDLPLVDTVTRDEAGYRQIVPPSMVNQYAAMPSFHAGWNLLAGIVVFHATRRPWLRVLAVLGPAAMMFAVVATANHYVLDVVVGVSIVLACLVARDLVHARQTRRPRIERCDERHVPRRAPGWERSRPAPERRVARHPAHRG
jgi:membrane-associated phospholipid phosphatase